MDKRLSLLPIALLFLIAAASLRAQPATWYHVASLPWGDTAIVHMEADSIGNIYALVAQRTKKIDASHTITYGALWRTRDGGVSWERIASDISTYWLIVDRAGRVYTSEYDLLAILDQGEVDIWIVIRDSTGQELYRFKDRINAIDWNGNNTVIGVDETRPTDTFISSVLLCTADTIINFSMNHGWENDYQYREVSSVVMLDDGTALFSFLTNLVTPIKPYTGFYRITPGDTQPALIDSGFISRAMIMTRSGVLIASDHWNIFRSNDTGRTWQIVDTTHPVVSLAIGPEGTLYAFNPGTLRSRDDGLTWQQTGKTEERIWSAQDGAAWTLIDNLPQRSTHQDLNWTTVSRGLPEGKATTLVVAADGSVYATGKNGVGLYRLERERTLDVERFEEGAKLMNLR